MVQDTTPNPPATPLRAALTGALAPQAWLRERRPRLRTPPEGDTVALNAILLAAVQQLALSASIRPNVGGMALDDAGWARIEAALDVLLIAVPE